MAIYSAEFNNIAVTAVQDFFEVLSPSDAVLVFLGLFLSQHSDAGDAQSEQLRCLVQRVTGAPTSGSGGSTATPRPVNSGEVASGATVEINNTTQISGGTSVNLHPFAFNVMAGYDLWIPEMAQWIIAPSTRLVIALEAAPADSLSMNGAIYWNELGG